MFQVLKGTHRCGRIEHELVSGQTCAERVRVEELKKHYQHIYADLKPGLNIMQI